MVVGPPVPLLPCTHSAAGRKNTEMLRSLEINCWASLASQRPQQLHSNLEFAIFSERDSPWFLFELAGSPWFLSEWRDVRLSFETANGLWNGSRVWKD